MTAPPAPSFEERFAALGADWRAQLPARLATLQQLLGACLAAPQDTAVLQDLHRGVHSLAGSAGTFGLPALSVQAKSIEHQIEPLLESPARTAADLAPLQPAMDALLAHAGG
jgi:HPt (histidine-containing phosphotransfer) domain-containing protein